MSWFKIDDLMPDHPKHVEAGPAASWLWVCAGTYCSRYLTDGRVPKTQIPKLTPLENYSELVAILLRVGLLEHHDGAYWVHDYLDYNPSKAEIEASKENRQEGNRLGAAITNHRRWHTEKPDPTCRYCRSPVAPERQLSDSSSESLSESLKGRSIVAPSPSPSPSPIPNPVPKKEEFPIVADKPRPVRVSPEISQDEIQNLVSHYVATVPDRRGYSVTPARRKVILEALRTFGPEVCRTAIEVFATHSAYAHHRGENESGKRYNGLCEYVLSYRCKPSKVRERIEEIMDNGGFDIEETNETQELTTITGLGNPANRNGRPDPLRNQIPGHTGRPRDGNRSPV